MSLNPATWFRPRATISETTGDAERIIRSLSLQYLSDSGAVVSVETAKRFSTVYACVRLISDTVAQMPCKLKEIKNENVKNATDDPLYVLLSMSPENGLTSFDFWKKLTESLLYRGYAVARVIRTFGKIARLIPVTNIQKIERDQYGKYTFTYLTENSGQQTLSQDDALFSFYSLDDNMLPLSPIEVNRNSIGLGISAEKHNSRVFKSGGRPSGTLDLPGTLDKKVRDSIKESWDRAYSLDGDGGIAILEGGAKYAAISMTNEAAQLLQSRQFQKQDICGIFGVPPHMISDTTQAKGWSTMEQLMTEFLTLAINPISIRYEQSMDKQLVDKKDWFRKYTMFESKGLLRGDTATRQNYYATGIDRGWLEINEVRKLEDMNPLPPDRIAAIEERNKTKQVKPNEQQAATGIAKAA